MFSGITDWITDWIKEILIGSITESYTTLFTQFNSEIVDTAGKVGTSPSEFLPTVYDLIKTLSDTVIVPIAGVILTFICTWEFIQMIIDMNNLSNLDTWIFFKWIFKTFVAVVLLSNCFTICMAVFDVAQNVIKSSSELLNDSMDINTNMEQLTESLNELSIGQLLITWIETMIMHIAMPIMWIVIFCMAYGRMIEIYLMVSLAPIPFSTFANREQSMIGQNYLRSLAALAFQGFLIMICFAIYAGLLLSPMNEDVTNNWALWETMGYTVLLMFTISKTGSLSKSIFNAH